MPIHNTQIKDFYFIDCMLVFVYPGDILPADPLNIRFDSIPIKICYFSSETMEHCGGFHREKL